MAAENIQFIYNGAKAAAYADKWWNNFNPAFPSFPDNDCTNYISQSLYAGGMPMKHTGAANSGWWARKDNWSYSWTVANSLRWYLSSLQGKGTNLVNSANELEIGDVISYDFNGDGRWDHNSIVTAKTSEGSPLVNAHTANSFQRLWNYETSPAYDPARTRYLFWHITGNPPHISWRQPTTTNPEGNVSLP